MSILHEAVCWFKGHDNDTEFHKVENGGYIKMYRCNRCDYLTVELHDVGGRIVEQTHKREWGESP